MVHPFFWPRTPLISLGLRQQVTNYDLAMGTSQTRVLLLHNARFFGVLGLGRDRLALGGKRNNRSAALLYVVGHTALGRGPSIRCDVLFMGTPGLE